MGRDRFRGHRAGALVTWNPPIPLFLHYIFCCTFQFFFPSQAHLSIALFVHRFLFPRPRFLLFPFSPRGRFFFFLPFLFFPCFFLLALSSPLIPTPQARTHSNNSLACTQEKVFDVSVSGFAVSFVCTVALSVFLFPFPVPRSPFPSPSSPSCSPAPLSSSCYLFTVTTQSRYPHLS